MQAGRLVTRARSKLLLTYPFWGSLALHLEVVEAPEQPTCATDGKHLFYNPDFVASLTDAELLGVVAHEVGHCILGHLWRQGDRNHEKWAQAADFALNNMLRDEGFTLPKGCLDGHKGMSAEQVYNKIKNKKKGPSDPTCNPDPWGQEADPGEGDADGEGTPSYKDAGINPADAQKWANQAAATAQSMKGTGNVPGSILDQLGELLRPQVDWRALLQDFMQSASVVDYQMKPNKRYIHQGWYGIPSTRTEDMEIVIAIDTSGSVSAKLLNVFMSEVRSIVEGLGSYTLHLYAADAEVSGYYEIHDNEGDWPDALPGRGGTDFRPVFTDVEDRGIEPMCMVYLTDAYGPFPDEPDYPVIWCVVEGGADVPWGTRVEVKENE